MRKWKVIFLLVLFLFFFIAIILRLAHIQIINKDYWMALAQGQHKRFLQTSGNRGEIFATDRLGNLYPLAINRSWDYVYISPSEIASKELDLDDISLNISEIIKVDIDIIKEKINKTSSSYEVLKTRISNEESVNLKKALIPGVYIRQDILRYYPENTLASHVIGFLGGEKLGQYGIENYYNDILEGRDVLQEAERSIGGGYLINKTFGNLNSGDNINLTIDYNIQFEVEKRLAETAEKLNIDAGTVLVGDPHTGKIIALANYPTFNPNEYFKEKDYRIFKNNAIQSIFEPGSIFKPITMAIALEEEKVTADTKYYDTGITQIGSKTIRNYNRRVWGEVDMRDVLEKSINTAMVFVQKSIGDKLFQNYLEKFKLFSPTGIDLQGEVYSENISFKKDYEINFANASFGQGVEFTVMQLFRAFSVLANGGRLIDPHIVEREVFLGERIISPQTSSEITSMMVSVVDGDYAKTARVPGYYVAGKTGTAQVSWSALGIPSQGYSDKTIQSFIGYAPALDPSFIIIVKLDNPETRTAEYSATPLFGEIAKYIINYYQISPER